MINLQANFYTLIHCDTQEYFHLVDNFHSRFYLVQVLLFLVCNQFSLTKFYSSSSSKVHLNSISVILFTKRTMLEYQMCINVCTYIS